MILLGIDTATLTASAAVVRGDAGAAAEVLAAADGGVSTHSENLLPLIDGALQAAGVRASDIDAVAVGAGPGSFTGLRIGMATAKGFAFAAGRPLWAVSSLAAMALEIADRAGDGGRVLLLPLLDARRDEIFAGFYERDGLAVRAIAPERVLPPEELAAALDGAIAAGAAGATGAAARYDAIHAAGDALAIYFGGGEAVPLPPGVTSRGGRATPSAAHVARLALTGNRADILAHGSPVYIRPSEAEVKYPDGVPKGLKRPRG